MKISSNQQNRSVLKEQAKQSANSTNRSLHENLKKLRNARTSLNTLITQKSDLLKSIREEKTKHINDQRKNIEEQNSLRQQQISNLERKIEDLNRSMFKEMDDSFLSSSKTRIKQTYEGQISALQSQVNNLVNGDLTSTVQSDFSYSVIQESHDQLTQIADEKIAEQQALIKALEAKITKQRSVANSSLNKQFAEIDKVINQEYAKLEMKHEELEDKHSESLGVVSDIQEENWDLKKQVRFLNTDLDKLYLSNQIYRMASHIDGTTDLDKIKTTTVTLVAVVWFGSLALICSIIGPALVLLSLHLRSRSYLTR